jgi:hypothetical protein
MKVRKKHCTLIVVMAVWLWSHAAGAQTLSWEVLDPAWINWETFDLASSGEQLVAVGLGEHVLTSSDDGQSWPINTSGLGIERVTWGDAGFVGVGPNKVLLSSDGVTWVDTTPSQTVFWGSDVCWDGNRYLIAGLGSLLLSDDGMSWTESVNQPTPDLFPSKIITFRDRILIGARKDTAWGFGKPKLVYGTPEQGWITEDTPELSNGRLSGLAASPSLALAVAGWYGAGDGPYSCSSRDGQQWISQKPPARLWDAIYFNGRFYCAGGGENLLVSTTDGVVWESELATNGYGYLTNLVIHDDMLIGIGPSMTVRGSLQAQAAVPTMSNLGMALLMIGIIAIGWMLLARHRG